MFEGLVKIFTNKELNKDEVKVEHSRLKLADASVMSRLFAIEEELRELRKAVKKYADKQVSREV